MIIIYGFMKYLAIIILDHKMVRRFLRFVMVEILIIPERCIIVGVRAPSPAMIYL